MDTIFGMSSNIGQMAQELARTNLWWREPSWAAQDPDLRLAKTTGIDYHADCLENLEPGTLYILRGPRRVGKTVTVKESIQRLQDAGVPPRSIVHVAADGYRLGQIRTTVQNAQLPPLPAGQQRWWFVDEITKISGDWASEVKWLRDNDPGFNQATVVLTGSDANELTKAAGDLAGRRGRAPRTDRTLLPIGFRTFVSLMRPAESWPTMRLSIDETRSRSAIEAFGELVPWLDALVGLWEIYLQWGGFPVAVGAARQGLEAPEWFLDDIFKVIFNDAFKNSNLSEVTAMSLFSRLMSGMASPVNLSNIASAVGVDQSTVTRHIEYLKNAYLAWPCPQKAAADWLPRERAQGKIYAADPLLARLAHLKNMARPDVDITVLAEMQIGMAIRRSFIALGRPWDGEYDIFYFKTPARKAIDFVSEALNGVAIEGKYTESGKWKREAKTVEASEYDGILATRNVLDTSSVAGAWAVPAGMLAYLIDS